MQQIASSEAVLNQDEREIGGARRHDGTTDIAIYQSRAIKYTTVIPLSGNR